MSAMKEHAFAINHSITWVKGDGMGLPRKKAVEQTVFDLIKIGEPTVTFSVHSPNEIFVESVRRGTTDRIWMLMTVKEARRLWKSLVAKGYKQNK